jgi:hypothetical protein
MDGVRFRVEVRDFSLLHSVHKDSGAHPASYLIRIGGYFQRVNGRMGHEAGHSQPTNGEVESSRAIPPLPHTYSW